MTEADFSVLCNGSGNAEGLKPDTDGFGGVRCFLGSFLDRDRAADGVCPACIVESDGLNAFYDLRGIDALVETDLSRIIEIFDSVFFKSSVDLVYSSFVTFK